MSRPSLSREAITACVVTGRRELPPTATARYAAFVDPAGGSGSDSFTLGIAHAVIREDNDSMVVVIDAVRETRPPFSPESVVADYAALLQTYGVALVVGDRWGGEWPREGFAKHGISYVCAEQPKSNYYRDSLPALNSGQLEWLEQKGVKDSRGRSPIFAAGEKTNAEAAQAVRLRGPFFSWVFETRLANVAVVREILLE